MKTKQFFLKNGLPVICMINPTTSLSYACLCVNAGAKDDTPSHSGLAHAVEHFLFTGSAHHSKQDINDIPSRYGSFLDASTDLDTTSFGFRVLNEHFSSMLHLLADVILYPTFPEVAIKSEIEVIKIEMTNDDENETIGYNLHSCFGVKKRKANVFGSLKSLSHFTPKIAYNFWNKYYTAKNSVLCIICNNEDCIALAEECFGDMRPGEHIAFRPSPFSGRFYNAKKDNDNVEISLIFAEQNVTTADEVLANVLGGNYSSRIYQKLRNELSLAYLASADINTYSCGSMFYISATCFPRNLDKVVEVICNEIVSLRENLINSDELKCAKNVMKTALLLEAENPDNLLFEVAEDYILGRFVPIDEKIRQIESVTRDDVLASARRIFNHRPTYGVIGEAQNIPSYQEIMSMLWL